jgi:spore germination cell wall hydrolase CwlJ-like protein
MDDKTLLALCVWSEAAGEPLDGKRAVAHVVLNRMRAKYSSDGTVTGTVLAPNQFSGFWFDFQGDSYVRVCKTPEDALARAARLLLVASKAAVWPVCQQVAADALSGDLPPNPDLDGAVLYLNPRIIKHLPIWASADKQLCSVGRHDFYRA